MKKLLLAGVCSFIIVFLFLYLTGQKTARATSRFLKTVNDEPLHENGSINIGGISYRLYLYEDSLFFLLENKKMVSVDTALTSVTPQRYSFDLASNSVWYFNKENGVYSFLCYPNGSILQKDSAGLNRFGYHSVINNCVNTGSLFWGQTYDSADTRAYITSFDMKSHATEARYDMYEIFKNSNGFSAECFNSSMDGSFIKINDSSFLFYNYYSSYFLWFNGNEYKVYTGIDSVPLRRFKKITAKVEGYEVERCMADNERFVHLSGCADQKYIYMLSNISNKKVNGQRLVDIYDAGNMHYKTSFIIPSRQSSLPFGITTSAGSGSLYITYDDNTLVKFHKPI